LPEEAARKQDEVLFSVRYEITGKQAFGIIDPSSSLSFGHGMREAILSMAVFHEQMLQKACEDDFEKISAEFRDIENNKFLMQIGFPIRTAEGMGRYIDLISMKMAMKPFAFAKNSLPSIWPFGWMILAAWC
jgi:hypothetical protein